MTDITPTPVTPPLGLSEQTTKITSLPTELLVRLFSYLPAKDLLSVQNTNRRIRDLVADSSSLQYFLRIEVNRVEDLLPPDASFAERLTLLRQHEKSWNNLHYTMFTEDSSNEIPQDRLFILQDGYLIYRMLTRRGGTVMRYGYADLYSTSRNGGLRWVHIPLQHIRFPSPLKLEFSVDYNLTVAISQQFDRSTVDISFFEFTTGAFHPLAPKLTVQVQSPITPVTKIDGLDAEIIGDYVLLAVTYEYIACYVFLISWKTGTSKLLRELFYRQTTEWRKIPKLVGLNENLIAVVEDNTNSIEICRLEHTPDVRLERVCFLELPPLKSNAFVSVSRTEKEWVSTSKYHLESDATRKRPVPFRSSKVSSIRLALDYHIHVGKVYTDYPHTMIVSVPELLNIIHTNTKRNVPWDDWGPARTRIFPRLTILQTAGPCWINNYSPLTIRDYDFLRARCSLKTTSSSSSVGIPVFSRSKLEGEQWAEGAVETCLPYRDSIVRNLNFHPSTQRLIADREWVVVISLAGTTTHVFVYHVG